MPQLLREPRTLPGTNGSENGKKDFSWDSWRQLKRIVLSLVFKVGGFHCFFVAVDVESVRMHHWVELALIS